MTETYDWRGDVFLPSVGDGLLISDDFFLSVFDDVVAVDKLGYDDGFGDISIT